MMMANLMQAAAAAHKRRPKEDRPRAHQQRARGTDARAGRGAGAEATQKPMNLLHGPVHVVSLVEVK